MSISKLTDMDLLVLFSKTGYKIFMSFDYSLVFGGFRKDDLYLVDFSKGPQVSTCLIVKATKGWLWHCRLGHAGMRNLQEMVKHKHIEVINDVKFNKDRLCSVCEAGKQVKSPHPAKTVMTTTSPLELLHLVLFRPRHYKSFGGNSYGLIIVDDFTRFT